MRLACVTSFHKRVAEHLLLAGALFPWKHFDIYLSFYSQMHIIFLYCVFLSNPFCLNDCDCNFVESAVIVERLVV